MIKQRCVGAVQLMVVDLDALRTMIAVADRGQFQEAAAELSITQQAVSKRVAALETELGARLFTRTPRGVRLTVDGQAFLPHARAVLAAAARAVESVKPGRRALRVDVLGRRMAPASVLRAFHTAHSRIALDVVTLGNEAAALEAVVTGSVDATFRTGRTRLPPGLASTCAVNETLDLLTGPAHELAGATSLRLEDLAGQRIWLPGFVAGAEWSAYYEELAAAFGLRVDTSGPNFGIEHVLDVIGGSPDLCTFMGSDTVVDWAARRDLRRVPLRHPTPVYPHLLIWRTDNRHPGLRALREHLGHARKAGPGEYWLPSWA
jgi:DNA-binding transcriptional LysR family regulator